jgi:trigger factor
MVFVPARRRIKVIRQQFGMQVHREVIGELLQSSFAEAVTENKLSPAGNPRIEPQSIDEGQDLKYVATFEVFPEVSLQPFDTLDLERVTAQVTDGDIDAMIERLRKQQMKYGPVERAPRRAATRSPSISWARSTARSLPAARPRISASCWARGACCRNSRPGLIGAVAGEHRDITVNFPADYRATELAGKQAIFSTTIKKVEEPTLPELDEEFCTSFGVSRGRHPEAARGCGRQYAPRARAELAQSQQDGGDGEDLPGQPHRCAERPARVADPGHADRSHAPCRRQGRVAGAAARALVEPARRRVALGLIFNDVIRRENLVLDPQRANARLDEMVGAYGDPAGPETGLSAERGRHAAGGKFRA